MVGVFPFALDAILCIPLAVFIFLISTTISSIIANVVSHHHALLVFCVEFTRRCHDFLLILLYPLSRVFNLSRNMKSLKGAFALGLLPTTAVAQSVVTVRLPTCIPGGGTGILGGGTGIPGVGTGVISGPAPTGPTTEVINVTATISPGSITVEQVTQVITPGASAT